MATNYHFALCNNRQHVVVAPSDWFETSQALSHLACLVSNYRNKKLKNEDAHFAIFWEKQGFVKASYAAASCSFPQCVFPQIFAEKMWVEGYVETFKWETWGWGARIHSNHEGVRAPFDGILHGKQIRRPKLFWKFTVAGLACSQWLHNNSHPPTPPT